MKSVVDAILRILTVENCKGTIARTNECETQIAFDGIHAGFVNVYHKSVGSSSNGIVVCLKPYSIDSFNLITSSPQLCIAVFDAFIKAQRERLPEQITPRKDVTP